MRSDRIRILNFDNSVTLQKEFLRGVAAVTVDLTGIGPAARLWADQAQADAIRRSLDPGHKDWITFLGSGDYHYVSSLLLEQFDQPLTVVAFDHHPDWDTLPPRYGCGAWVSRALEQKNVAQVVLVGTASDDLAFPSIVTGNLYGLRSNRIITLPYEAPRRQVWPFDRILWRELKADPLAVFSHATDQLLTHRVYVSIDKDCLTTQYALTNWEEGRLGLDTLLSFLRILNQKCEIVGLDVTGEYSSGSIPSRWKSWCSRIDHPRHFSARNRSLDEVAQVNGATNQRILDALSS